MTDELRKELKLKAIDVREGILTATHGAILPSLTM